MAYAYRCHANSGPTKVNRTSWGPMTSPAQIDIPVKAFGRPLSANYDRIFNTFDRTNTFECVRSVFEQASQNNNNNNNNTKIQLDMINEKCNGEDKKDRFFGSAEVVVNGGNKSENLSSSFERADVGLASKQTPCDEEVAEYYRDRLYMSQARQLFPLQEDLADWINKTIGITHLTGDNFLNALDNGVELCLLATILRDKAKEAAEKGLYSGPVPQVRERCWQRAARRSFFSRDNMENFITFCKQLGVHENLLFESDDLVLHAQPRNVILCLLEVARIATKFNVEPPGLVQLEKEIALEEAGVIDDKDSRLSATLGWQFQQDTDENKETDAKLEKSPSPIEEEVSLPVGLFNTENEDNRSVNTDDTWSRCTPEDLDVPLKPLTELDKRVQIVTRLMQRNCNCSEGKCSKMLKVKKVGEGRYNIAGRNVFIRLLKGRHMMVRVGGGWDTLEHFLTRHDPCQVRLISAQSSSASPKVTTVDLVQPPPTLDTTAIENAIIDSIEAQSKINMSGNGDISPIDMVTSIVDSISETSSVNSTTLSNISKTSNDKNSSSSGKSTPNSVKSNSNRHSGSGRITPQSAGKASPRNSKPSMNGKISPSENKPHTNGKMSPSSLKLDLSTPASNRRIKSAGIINNRMISPIESSTRLLPALSKTNNTNIRSPRTPTSETRKSLPMAVMPDIGATRRRSLNLSLTSTNSKPLKSPSRTNRSQSLKSPINYKPLTSVTSPKSPINHVAPIVSPSSIEKSIKMALPLQNSTPNKPYLQIRAKYRSPPPRDIPPR